MLFSLFEVGLCSISPSLFVTHSFHLLYPVHFFRDEDYEGGERGVFNSFRPYSTQFSFSPLNIAHNVDPAHKYLPGSLSLSIYTHFTLTWDSI